MIRWRTLKGTCYISLKKKVSRIEFKSLTLKKSTQISPLTLNLKLKMWTKANPSKQRNMIKMLKKKKFYPFMNRLTQAKDSLKPLCSSLDRKAG